MSLDPIALYRREKAAYLARHVDKDAAALERVREQLSGTGGLQPIIVSEKGRQIAAGRFAASRARGQKKATEAATALRSKRTRRAS